MGFAVLHLDKAAGSDSAMSSHIERRIAPQNADEKRTHLNRELVEFPARVEDRTQAIQHRLDTAGITRKIGRNQVRAIRVLLSGSPDAMKRIEQTGQLDAWCRHNLDWLQCTFGRENVVSAVLHMDETTPHIHATVVPIVRGERRKAKTNAPRKYRKKKDAPRLCADDVMSRPKLKEYQTSYAECVARYGLQRGIDGSEAKHITCSQFYKEVFLQQSAIAEKVENLKKQRATLSVDITALQARQAEAQAGYSLADEKRRSKEQELAQVKRELSKTQVKQKAATATETVLDGIVSLFDDSKQKKALRQIEILKQENNDLRSEIDKMQTEHAKERDELMQNAVAAQHEIALHHKLMPELKDWLMIEATCREVGFSEGIKTRILNRQSVGFSGELYSAIHRRWLKTKHSVAKVEQDPMHTGHLRLTIDGIDVVNWLRQKNAEQYPRPQIKQPQHIMRRKGLEIG